ncbi:beta-lactamase family protein [Thermoleophilia bacterium SCSIO 60948]|nr:beta-lactamase family protein [Thermoleophilia bacterium SCSIO 60948]
MPANALADKSEERQLQRALDRLTSKIKGGPPGASVLLRRGEKQTFLTSGRANLETNSKFGPNKSMRLASTSKAYSGAVALTLVDEGLLELDDTIGEKLPDLPDAWSAVTLGQVLQHRGGVPNYTTDPDFIEYFSENLTEEGITIPELIDFVADEPLEYTPGTSFKYSNTDNLIVALFAEQATGLTYRQLLQRQVFDPLELSRTDLPPGVSFFGPKIRGYDLLPLQDITECCSMAFVSASGGLVSTPFELMDFMRNYAGGKMFSAGVREQQFAFKGNEGNTSEPPGPGLNSAGLGVFRYESRCGTVFGHTGNFPGYTQFAATNRSGRKALSFSVNRQIAPDAPGRLAQDVFPTLREDYELAVCALLD